ncbi:hypothetical protein [Rossellomorea marisflavi]|uniref:hypothetical protein n=1 Tax=Rossellomorea marisflavi TaxID=189381 RepID=UPI0020798858|nr:hypothetical protein [Rossellomorea marisflavi]USK92964.1 hypothetical protein LIT29_04220 [Rossellomorea marisflavi]
MTTVTFTASTAGKEARMEQTFTLEELNTEGGSQHDNRYLHCQHGRKRSTYGANVHP